MFAKRVNPMKSRKCIVLLAEVMILRRGRIMQSDGGRFA